MTLFTRASVLDVEGDVLGAFLGEVFVASLREAGRELLAKWTSPEAEAELVTPLGPRIVAVAASPDDARVALAGVTEGFLELLVATLDPPSGIRLVQPSARLAPEPEAAPRLLWSDDGRRLAFGGLLGSSEDHVLTMVFDLAAGPKKPSVVFGRPAGWKDDVLCVSLADAHTGWSAAEDAEVPWDGARRHIAPDGSVEVMVSTDAAVTITRAGESARPLVAAPKVITWVGPHHLATDDGRALDVLTRSAVDVLPRGGAARLVALSRDGRSGVFTQDGRVVWAASAR